MDGAPRTLAPDAPVEGRLGAGQVDVFELQLDQDQFVQLVAEQRGLDVLLRLFDPHRLQLTEVDTPQGAQGAEELIEVAAAAGRYRLEVWAAGGDFANGSYRLRIAALRPATEADRRRVAADHIFNTGEALRRQRKGARALVAYRRAARQWKALGDVTWQATCRYRMGWMKHALGALPQAEVDYAAALALLGESGEPALRAAIWNRRGRALVSLAIAQLNQARQAHERAFDLFHGLDDRAGEAAALSNLGRALESTDAAAAVASYRRAADLWQALGDADEGAKTRESLARLQPPPGDAATPADAPRPVAGASLAARGAAGDAAGGRGRFGEALSLSRLGAALARSGRLDEAAASYAEAFAPGLAADTLVLRYDLAEERSVLWTATAGGASGYRLLPGRAVIEAAARRLFDSAAQEGAAAEQGRCQAASELSRMLLTPVAAELGERRLVLVVEGCLDRVPFALLPEPEPEPAAAPGQESGDSRPLLARHEIVVLPAATAEVMFDRRPGRDALGIRRGPVVVGGPVLRADDPRLARVAASAAPRAEGSPDLAAALAGLGLRELPPLPWSLAEAEAIIAIAPQIGTPHALGFDANLDLLRGGSLRGFRIQHLAALVLLSAEGAGLVLSRFDEHGGPREEFLRLHELRGLDLQAELLVVTGTRLAWDAEAGGLGLVRAATLAGAAMVVTSLWSVDDESAVELMRRFYRALLLDDLEPPAALRRAQRSIAGEARWSAPRHWAGFLVSGDWSDTGAAETGSDTGGTIEASDKGGTGDSGKPGNDYHPGASLPEGVTFEEAPE